MDSLSQIALGSAVSIAAMGRRTSPWRAAVFGAVCGTLPDLDVFINHGDPLRNMTMHRAESHALVYLTLISPLLAWGMAKVSKELHLFKRWWLAAWLALITHPLLDTMTVYGTQLWLPFTNHPYGVGSIFIIDPLYTLPLLIGTGIALARWDSRGVRWNMGGLLVSTLYLIWGVAIQWHVTRVAERSLQEDGVTVQQLLVTPLPLNTIAWRVLAIEPQRYGEGFYSLFDRESRMTFNWFPRGEEIYRQWHGDWNVDRLAWFTRGFFKMSEQDNQVQISDLRMGQEPYYTFTFIVGERSGETLRPIVPRMASKRPDVSEALRWVWQRARGETPPPPR